MNPLAATALRSTVFFAALLLVAPVSARALQDATPVPATAAPDSTAASSQSAKIPGKRVKAPRTKKAKVPRVKQAKAPRVKQARAPKTPRVRKTAAAPDSASAKPAKVANVREPEPSFAEQRKLDGIYAKRTNWMSLWFGYAKRTGDVTGEGLVGYGLAYQRMLSRRLAFEAGAAHDIVGHFGGELDEVVPFTAEFQRHFQWHTAVRPFIGVGGGFYLHKSYRTGSDYNTTTTGGPHFSVGFSSELDANHVIGFVVRVASIKGRPGIVNPTFGPDTASETIWTAKIGWGLAY